MSSFGDISVGDFLEKQPEPLPVTERKLDEALQIREKIDGKTVDEYEERMEVIDGKVVDPRGREWPPTVEYFDGEKYWTADGWHRIFAAMQKEIETYPSIIKEGTRRDALLHAAGANDDHGLKRTKETTKRALEVLMNDEEWGQWSQSMYAEHLNVHPSTISRYKQELINEERIEPRNKVRVKRGGREYEMDTSAIRDAQKERHQKEKLESERSSRFEESSSGEVSVSAGPAKHSTGRVLHRNEDGVTELEGGTQKDVFDDVELVCADYRTYARNAASGTADVLVTRIEGRDRKEAKDLASAARNVLPDHGVVMLACGPLEQFHVRQEFKQKGFRVYWVVSVHWYEGDPQRRPAVKAARFTPVLIFTRGKTELAPIEDAIDNVVYGRDGWSKVFEGLLGQMYQDSMTVIDPMADDGAVIRGAALAGHSTIGLESDRDSYAAIRRTLK